MFSTNWLFYSRTMDNIFNFNCNGFSLPEITTADLKDAIVIVKNHLGIPINGIDNEGKTREGYRITNAQKLATSILHNRNDRRWTEAIATFEGLVNMYHTDEESKEVRDLEFGVKTLEMERDMLRDKVEKLEKELNDLKMIPIKATRPRPAKKPTKKPVVKVTKSKK